MEKPIIAAVGSYGSPDSHNLRLLQITGQGSGVEQTAAVSAGINPACVAPSRDGRFLYVLNETNRTAHKTGGTLRTYAVARDTGGLTLAGETETEGDDPCHVSETPSGNCVIAANYSSGTLTVLAKDRHGIPRSAVHKIRLIGFGPDRRRQNSAHPHGVYQTPDSRFLYVPDLGSDRIWIYTISEDGKLRAAPFPAVTLPPGSGPRSMAFDPVMNSAFCLTELASTVVQFRYDRETGFLHRHKEVSTLPFGFSGRNAAAELQIYNHTVLVSNRGHDSIFRIPYDESGFIDSAYWFGTGGRMPGSFAVVPENDDHTAMLIVANQQSDSLILFSIGSQGARIVRELKVPKPSCVRLLPELQPARSGVNSEGVHPAGR